VAHLSDGARAAIATARFNKKRYQFLISLRDHAPNGVPFFDPGGLEDDIDDAAMKSVSWHNGIHIDRGKEHSMINPNGMGPDFEPPLAN
jgi:hypothetical protein